MSRDVVKLRLYRWARFDVLGETRGQMWREYLSAGECGTATEATGELDLSRRSSPPECKHSMALKMRVLGVP